MYLSGVDTAINNSVFQIAGAQVAVDAINKAGGLKGRQVEMIVCNHQDSAAVAIQCAQQAADQKIDIVQRGEQLPAAEQPDPRPGEHPADRRDAQQHVRLLRQVVVPRDVAVRSLVRGPR